MRSKQKKLKFSKGQINERLLERQDLEFLDNSASEITNLVSTPYGSVQTRQGTEYIDVDWSGYLEFETSSNYGDASVLEDGELFTTSDIAELPIGTSVLDIDLGSVLSVGSFSLNMYVSGVATLIQLSAIQTSTDSITYNDLDSNFNITDTPTTYQYDISDTVRYIRVTVRNYNGSFGDIYINFNNILINSNVINNARIEPFVFNEDEQYLVAILNNSINIYDGATLDQVNAVGLLDAYIQELSITQKEDIMIITHPDIATKQLVRTKPLGVVTWTFSDLTLENIPKYAFDGETKTQPAVTLTPDGTDGNIKLTVGSGTFTFDASSVGQYIDAGTAGGGRARIVEYIDSANVRASTIIPFYTTDAIASGSWDYITGYEDVWSATRGYPTTCLFHEQRLWFGGCKGVPSAIFGSRTDDYNNFLNTNNYESDAIFRVIDANQSTEILALYPNRGIQVFCAGSEWIIPEGNLTPGSIQIAKNTANGIIKGIYPVDISGTTLFIEKNGKSLLSFVYNDGQASYVTSQLSQLTDLINSPIDMDIAYNSTQNRANYLYIVLDDGTMVVACILLDQKINSYVKFETEGEVKDVCVLGEDVYILVSRNGLLLLEKFNDYRLDSCILSSETDTITGLDHLNGEDVEAYDSVTYENLGTYTVSGGEIELDETATHDVIVGLPFDYSLTSNKIAINSQTENIEKRIAKATVVTNDTDRLTFCGQTQTQTDDLYDYYGVTSPSRDPRFTISGSFYPIEILSILLNLNYGDK